MFYRPVICSFSTAVKIAGRELTHPFVINYTLAALTLPRAGFISTITIFQIFFPVALHNNSFTNNISFIGQIDLSILSDIIYCPINKIGLYFRWPKSSNNNPFSILQNSSNKKICIPRRRTYLI